MGAAGAKKKEEDEAGARKHYTNKRIIVLSRFKAYLFPEVSKYLGGFETLSVLLFLSTK